MMLQTIRRLFVAMAGCCAILSATPGHAATTQVDVSVAIKTLPLLTSKLPNSVQVAILFDPSSPASKMEADGIKAILNEGQLETRGVKFTGILVPVNDLGKMVGSRIAFLTGGLAAHYDAIHDTAANNNILTISTDLACVRANKCVLGIMSQPSVEIYYSKTAADTTKIVFGPAFTMLVKQI